LFHAILFYFFATVLIAAALGVIFSRNPVHAVMLLVLAFFQSAVLWLLIEVEFLALVLVLVYVGAVMVLFLFVVMMLDINVEKEEGGYARYLPLGLLVAGLMVTELIQVIWVRGNTDMTVGTFSATPEGYSNTKALGSVLYTEHVYAFEIAAVILLLAIIAAITLTMRKRPGLKLQNISAQVAVKAKDRVRIVKMESEKPDTESQE
jgi:NADH-quinone oxidoreductase subunit J